MVSRLLQRECHGASLAPFSDAAKVMLHRFAEFVNRFIERFFVEKKAFFLIF
jgi:hypothetical protein